MEKKRIEELQKVFNQLESKFRQKECKRIYASGAKKGDQVDNILSERDNQLKFRMEARNSLYLKKIGRALEKMETGNFGFCEECGQEIQLKRLLARPMTNYCIECKEEHEREDLHKLYEKKSHTIGKTFSSNNVITLPVVDEDDQIDKKVLKFNKKKINTEITF
jgi:DnaK suppressor protein